MQSLMVQLLSIHKRWRSAVQQPQHPCPPPATAARCVALRRTTAVWRSRSISLDSNVDSECCRNELLDEQTEQPPCWLRGRGRTMTGSLPQVKDSLGCNPASLPQHPPSSSNTPESGDSVYVLRLLRPLLGFVQIGLFASPELPISDLRHHRVEGRADVEGESPKGEGTGAGGGSSTIAHTDMRHIYPPWPPFLSTPPPSVLRRCWCVGSPPTPAESQPI